MMVKRNHVLAAWQDSALRACFALVILAIALAACSPAPAITPVPLPTDPPPTEAPTATLPPPATATLAPTQTQVPTATPTEVPPTPTQIPPLALASDGFVAWCAPISYVGSKPASPEAISGANMLTSLNDKLQVKIPAAYCTLSFKFNQAAPTGTTLVFSEGKSPFLSVPLTPVDGHPDQVWAYVNHAYVINPPLWQVIYNVAVLGPDGKELWSNPVKFAKPIPKNCPYGGLPDPVTLYCAVTDPWEIEPHPDATYPYDHQNLPPG